MVKLQHSRHLVLIDKKQPYLKFISRSGPALILGGGCTEKITMEAPEILGQCEKCASKIAFVKSAIEFRVYLNACI